MATAPTLILQPFAASGDVAIVPQTDPSSFVSFTTGYTPDYEISLASGNPAAKAVERPVQNWLFNLCTANLQAWQANGLPWWYANMPAGYSINAMVLRQNAAGTLVPYRSLVNNNISDPLSSPSNWEYVQFTHETLAYVPMPQGGASLGPTNALITSARDFNTITAGTFQTASDAVATACPNSPSVLGTTPVAGLLQSMQWTSGTNTFNAQIYADRNGQIFVRGATNGSWVNWRNLFAAANLYVVGELRLWTGTATAAAVLAAWGPGWHLADGTNGTINMSDRFVMGQSTAHPANTAGGSATSTLAVANMPAHNHVINIGDPGHTHTIEQSPHSHGLYDPGHNHAVEDPGHAHGVYDPGHAHTTTIIARTATAGGMQGYFGPSGGPINQYDQWGSTYSGTGISIAAAGTGIWLAASQTGLSMGATNANVYNDVSATGIYANSNNTGSGTAFSVQNPYYALCIVQYTGT